MIYISFKTTYNNVSYKCLAKNSKVPVIVFLTSLSTAGSFMSK